MAWCELMLSQIWFLSILAPKRVTPPPPIGMECPLWNVHTCTVVPAIALKALYILLFVVGHSAKTEDGHCCFCVIWKGTLLDFLEKESSSLNLGSGHSVQAFVVGRSID